MYPIKFENIYFEKIWGGSSLKSFRENVPEGNIGESWDISCHPNGMSIVANGSLKGRTLKSIIDEYGYDLMGNKVSVERFPLLIKLIDAGERLSVQVHPDDEYALKYERDQGKTEAWYVLKAEPGAKLIIGTKDCSKEEFISALEGNYLEKYLNEVPVKKGDCYLIKSGMVHAICEGVTIAEIQQSSDLTYRVYDYGRPRELHKTKALDVIDFQLKSKNLRIDEDKTSKKNWVSMCESEFFNIDKAVISGGLKDKSDVNTFSILTCVDGSGTIKGDDFKENIKVGDSFLIAATLGNYEINGRLTLLKSVPTK